MKIFILMQVWLLSSMYAQQGEWTIFNTSNSGLPSDVISTIFIDSDGDKWIATREGIAVYDGTEWTVFSEENSGLPSNGVNEIVEDHEGDIWIATINGVARYKDGDWKIYHTGSSGAMGPDEVLSAYIDYNGDRWFGTWGGGLVKYIDGQLEEIYSGYLLLYVSDIKEDQSGNLWLTTGLGVYKMDDTGFTEYTEDNSGLPWNTTLAIGIDHDGNKWFGSSHGLAKYDDQQWTVFNTTNSDLPHNYIVSIEVDLNGNIWLATPRGICNFNGVQWEVYNESNSALPDNSVNSILADKEGNLWVSTSNGIAIFAYDLTSDIEKTYDTKINYQLHQNYPNLFNPVTTIEYNIHGVEINNINSELVVLKVYDILGHEVATLINEKQILGNHSVQFNGSNLPSGVYFYQLQACDFSETKKFMLLK